MISTFSLSIASIFSLIGLSCQNAVVVIDSGSWLMKAGMAGDKLPSVVVRDVVAVDGDQTLVAQDALERRDTLLLSFPYNFGYCTGPYSAVHMWRHVLENELGVDPTTTSVVLTKSPVTSGEIREATSRSLLSLGVPEVTFQDTAVMTLSAAGLKTGLVVESGHAGTFVVPVIEGTPLDVSTQRLLLGGGDVSQWAAQLFGHPFDNMLNMNELDDFAEDLKKDSYVVLDVNKEPLSDDVIVDPMGNEVVVGNGYFMIPEIMFKPSLNNLPGPGLSEAIYLAIEDVDPAYHTLLYGNIVLGGGNCMFPGMGERIVNDLRVMTDHEVSYIAIENREYSAWIGASSF